jgi:hypothetical protein
MLIFSQPTDVGMHRLALSDADKEVRDWFVETTKSLGCDVKVDSMGETVSTFACFLKTKLLPRKYLRRKARKEVGSCYICRISLRQSGKFADVSRPFTH